MAEENDRVARGRAAYASQFRLSEAEAVEELERIVGPRMATEAINAAGGAWVDDSLSLRDRSLVRARRSDHAGQRRREAQGPRPVGVRPRSNAGLAGGARDPARRLCRVPASLARDGDHPTSLGRRAGLAGMGGSARRRASDSVYSRSLLGRQLPTESASPSTMPAPASRLLCS